MLTFIHAADFHLDSPFRDLSPSQAALRRSEQRELLKNLAALAREREADLVLLSGDLLDGENFSRETGEAFVTALGQTGCPVFIAPGNHDCVTARSPYCTLLWPENVHIFTEPEIRSVALPELNCTVYGAAFTAADREEDPLVGFAVPDDGQLHLMTVHGDVNGTRYAPISTESIAASGLDYVALGHIHAGSGLQRAGNTFWAYPGCPEGRGFDECGEKGVLVGTVEKGKVELEFVPIASRRYERLEVSLTGEADAEGAARAALAGHDRDCCRVIFTGETASSPDLTALERRLSDLCFTLSLRDRTTLARDLWARAGEDNLTGRFLREMRVRMDEAQSEQDRAVLELAVRFGLAALERGEDCRP